MGIKPVSLLEAIARMEGWLDARSRCRRNNNPGNIEAGRFAAAHGAVARNDGRFAVFPNPEAGFGAMRALLALPGYHDLTVAAALEKWAPELENDTAAYIANVCTWAGCMPHDRVADLMAPAGGHDKQ